MASIADILKALSCPCGKYDLTDEQENAAYHFEHRFLASLHRLYIHLPQEKADKIVGHVLKEIVAKLPPGD